MPADEMTKEEEAGVFGPVVQRSVSGDDAALARLGKKPVLKRNFGFMTILGFSCTVLITWEGSLVLVSLPGCRDFYVWLTGFRTFLQGLQK